MKAEAGIVRIQATMMLLATFQRTDATPRAAPTPMMQPVIVWVVETAAGDLRTEVEGFLQQVAG